MTTPPASIPLVSTIFGLTYLALALGKVPGLRIDRAGIALVGAAAMLACGVLSMRDAARSVDYETIVLLFGRRCSSSRPITPRKGYDFAPMRISTGTEIL